MLNDDSIPELSISVYERNFGTPGEVRYEFERGEDLVGIVSVSSTETLYFIHYINVMPDERGKGYGSKILKAICHKLCDKPIALELDKKSPFGMDKLQAWYERHGFVYMGNDYMVRNPY